MRKVLAIILLALAVGQASSVMSAEPAALGSISGRAIDAAGRAVAGQRMDLMKGGQVLAASITDTRGSWSFANVNPGEYVVRTNINGATAGTRVTVGTGQSVAGTLIVVPTSVVSPQFGVLAGVLANAALAGSAAAASAVAAVANPTDAVSLDPETVAEILTQLEPEARQAFAQAVVEAIANNVQGNDSNAQSNILVDVTPAAGSGTPQTNSNILTVINQIAVTPPSQAPPTITIVVTAS